MAFSLGKISHAGRSVKSRLAKIFHPTLSVPAVRLKSGYFILRGTGRRHFILARQWKDYLKWSLYFWSTFYELHFFAMKNA